MARTPRAQAIRALWIEPLSDWTVALVRAALTQHERGSMRQSARLADAMGRNPDVAGALTTRANALGARSALPFRVEPSDEGDGRKVEAVRKRQEQLWWYSVPEAAVGAIVRDRIMLGQGLGWIRWSSQDGEWVPRIEWVPQHGLEWQARGMDGRSAGCWAYTDDDGKRTQVTPGDGSWFLWEPAGPRSWLSGAVRTCAIPWIGELLTFRDWLRYGEKHGLPILEISEPHWAQDDVEGESGAAGSQADAYYAQFATLASESVLRSPQGADKDAGGWGAKWLEPISDTWETFRALIDRCKAAIHMAILQRDAAAAPRGGDGEVSTERVRSEALSSDAESFSTALREQLWAPWAEFGYGDRRLAGWGRWDTRQAPDMQARAKTLDTLGDALAKLRKVGVDTSPIVAEFGLVEDAEEPMPSAQDDSTDAGDSPADDEAA